MDQYSESTPTLWFRRRTPLIDPVFLIILIPLLSLLFIFFLIPPFINHASHILKPASVKSTSESLNIFLVVFAILCGLMSRKKDNVPSSGDVDGFVGESSTCVQLSSGHWAGYPLWRQEELVCDFDADVLCNKPLRPSEEEKEEDDEEDVKEIQVDTIEVVSTNAPECMPPSPPPPTSNSKRHTLRSVGKGEAPTNTKSEDLDVLVKSWHEHNNKTLERKVSEHVTTAISSFYNHTKGKKNKKKMRKLRNNISHDMSPPETQEAQQMHGPLPPPPPSIFKNLFKNGVKHNNNNNKKIHASIPPPPPPPSRSIFNNIFKSKRFHLPRSPPPPPRPPSIINGLFKNGTKSKRFNYIASSPPMRYPEPQILRSTKKKPPLTTKTNYYERDESGSESPLIPLPPPPPPFKMSDMMFELSGDFVKVQSTHSSVCSSPEHDLSLAIVDDHGDAIGPANGSVCFPSPDVNAKADSFISRLKDEWRMEQINDVNEKLP